jgi:hypothetical protein
MLRYFLALSFVVVTAHAQTGAATIDPGMTRAQVIERLGKPATVRTYQGSTYLLYSNKCGKKCGMQDLVILDHDVVVDAVFRSPDRHYSGSSSSPEATAPNARTQRNQSLALPDSQPGTAERVTPGTLHQQADSANSSMSHAPADSSQTSTSRAPQDSARSSLSHQPADSAPMRATAAPTPYGKPSPTPPPADSSRTLTSHPPADNAASSTSHPPKPPK